MFRKNITKFLEDDILKELEEGTFDWDEHLSDKYFEYYDDPDCKEVLAYVNGMSISVFKFTLNILSKNARDLLSRTLEVDRHKRISAQEALNHPYVVMWQQEDEMNIKPTLYDGLDEEGKTEEEFYDLVVKVACSFNG